MDAASFAVAALWGASPTFQTYFEKLGVHVSSIAFVSGLAYAIGGFIWWWVSGAHPIHFPVALTSGLIATMIPNLLYIYLISHPKVCPLMTTVLAFTAPAFTAIYASIFFGVHLGLPQLFGLFLVMLGTAFIVLYGRRR